MRASILDVALLRNRLCTTRKRPSACSPFGRGEGASSGPKGANSFPECGQTFGSTNHMGSTNNLHIIVFRLRTFLSRPFWFSREPSTSLRPFFRQLELSHEPRTVTDHRSPAFGPLFHCCLTSLSTGVL